MKSLIVSHLTRFIFSKNNAVTLRYNAKVALRAFQTMLHYVYNLLKNPHHLKAAYFLLPSLLDADFYLTLYCVKAFFSFSHYSCQTACTTETKNRGKP